MNYYSIPVFHCSWKDCRVDEMPQTKILQLQHEIHQRCIPTKTSRYPVFKENRQSIEREEGCKKLFSKITNA